LKNRVGDRAEKFGGVSVWIFSRRYRRSRRRRRNNQRISAIPIAIGTALSAGKVLLFQNETLLKIPEVTTATILLTTVYLNRQNKKSPCPLWFCFDNSNYL